MAFPAEFIDRLKTANPIADVIGSYVSLKKSSGRDFVCLCPFHNEKTPSCHVHTDKEYFHCFGCGAGGDVITFIMKYHNLDYVEAIKMLAERGGITMPEDEYSQRKPQGLQKKRLYEINKVAARFFFENLRSPEGAPCRQYLKMRGLTSKTIQKYGMGYAKNSFTALKDYMLAEGYSEKELVDASLLFRSEKNKKTYDFFMNRAVFPFIDLTGHIVGFGGRALSSDDKRKYLNSKDTVGYNKNRFLFSMNFAKDASVKTREIVLCEGNLDVISLNQAGIENAVASCGTALTPEQAKLLSNYADTVIICYDSDEAGQKATNRAIPILTDAGLKPRVIKIEKAKDPDEYIQRFGPVAFKNLLGKADGAVNYKLQTAKQGLDLETETDKVEYLKKAYQVISQLRSPSEREVYIGKLSREEGISTESITREVNSIINSRRKQQKKKTDRELMTFTDRTRDPLNPDAYLYPKEVIAEQGIIYYLFNNPDDTKEIMALIPPECFVTELNRRIYKSLTDKINSGEDFSVSAFNGEFSPDEMGKITEILSSGYDMGITLEVAEDYAAVINKKFSSLREKKASELSDDEFLKAFYSTKGI
ncbi:DNA primase [Ruminococcus sp. NK3A76]|uniref:DNA primase n=1 Tax=Ruminococcus sp. NK3A76 TaxID=877411 RepID=UPI00048D39BB|nr:DNA primase [Ruminococcus sp. NK3A76]